MKKLLSIFILCFIVCAAFANPANCINPQQISSPFTKDGAGEFCFVSTCMGASINSWNIEKIEINGVDYSNKFSDGIYTGGPWPAPIDGKYYIYYKGLYAWSHFEMTGTCSAGTVAPTVVPSPTPINTPGSTPNPIQTPQVTANPSPTPGTIPTAAPTVAPTIVPTPQGGVGSVWLSPSSQSVSVGGSFTIEIHANTGSSILGAFGFTVTYPTSIMSFRSMAEITPALNITTDSATAGLVKIPGFNAVGIPGSSDVALVRITFTTNVSGTGMLNLTVQNLNDITGATIGTPSGIGASVTITSDGTVPPTADPTPEPTPTEVPITLPPETISPTYVPTPGPIPGEGNIWFEPSSYTVTSGDAFATYIHVNTGDQILGAYGMDILFDSAILGVDGSFGNSGVESDGSGYITAGTGTPGLIRIAGFDTNGKGPSTNLALATVHWIAKGPGTSPLAMTATTLVNLQTEIIGLPSATNGSVTVNLSAQITR